MKKISSFISVILLLFLVSGCSEQSAPAQIAATTLPVYEFTARLCDGTSSRSCFFISGSFFGFMNKPPSFFIAYPKNS